MSEPVVTPNTEEWMVPCPFCGEFGSHKGTCNLSVARSGSTIVVFARRVDLRTKNHWGTGA